MIEIRVLGQADMPAAFDLATRVFAESSSLHRALGADLAGYRAYLEVPFAQMAQEGLCVVAVADHEVIGCMMAGDFARCTEVSPPRDPIYGPLQAITEALNGSYCQTTEVSAGAVLLVDMAAVDAGFAGRGVYQRMRYHVQHLAKERGFGRVIAELSSAATQHVVLNRLGHSKRAEIVFAEFEYARKRPFSGISDPPSLILAEGVL